MQLRGDVTLCRVVFPPKRLGKAEERCVCLYSVLQKGKKISVGGGVLVFQSMSVCVSAVKKRGECMSSQAVIVPYTIILP